MDEVFGNANMILAGTCGSSVILCIQSEWACTEIGRYRMSELEFRALLHWPSIVLAHFWEVCFTVVPFMLEGMT